MKKNILIIACTMLLASPPIFGQALSPDDNINSRVLRYWDNFNLANQNAATIEKTFVNYLQLLWYADAPTVEKSVSALLNKAENTDSVAFNAISSLFEKYLYNPNSPFRNEEFYIPVLKYLCASKSADFATKTRAGFRLKMALKNRVGELANDFEYTLSNGKKGKLSAIKADYILIFFNNPDCHDCQRVKDILSSNNLSKIKVLAIYPDTDLSIWKKTAYPDAWINGYNNTSLKELYDLKAIPTLYLLDKDKRVILKDADVEQIIRYTRYIF